LPEHAASDGGATKATVRHELLRCRAGKISDEIWNLIEDDLAPWQ
jgi:hypothetical protein